jgi:hypothetical protein
VKREPRAVPARPESDGGITVHNHLHPGHPYQAAIDELFRVALRGLPGPWEVSVCPVGRAWFRIDVVAPDGARWSLSVPVREGPRAEDLADTVRAAGVRHCRLRPKKETRGAGKAWDAPAGGRDGGPNAGSARGGAASAPFPTAPEGTSK